MQSKATIMKKHQVNDQAYQKYPLKGLKLVNMFFSKNKKQNILGVPKLVF